MNEEHTHELVIIGAGPGGYRAAFMASDLGLDVTLIDPEDNPGGICLYRGCIPTKTLLQMVKVKDDAEKAADKGIKFSSPEIDIDKIREWKESVVSKLTGGLGQLVKSRKINYIRAWAKFTDSNSLELSKENGDKEKIKFKNAIIATGVVPRQLPGIDNDMPGIMDSSGALELKDIPGKLLVVGGGYIGVEVGTAYRSFGSEVTITELTGNIMPGMDEDLLNEYVKTGGRTFKDIYLETKVENIKKKGKKLEVQFKSKEKGSFTGTFDRVLAAIGQQPRTEHLGLDNAGVKTSSEGFIQVNEKQQTSIKNIYAIGDISGPPLLAHKASYEGMIAAEVIAGKDVVNDARAMPMIVYTEPEIAACGLNETEAEKQGIAYKTAKFPWKASGRAMSMGEDHGFTKLLIDPETEIILGAGITGKNAGDLIPEIALAIEMGATAKDLALTIHPHPTLSETLMEAAELYYGNPVHIFKKKRKKT
ncbi:MAG: dihydrolipoyl dehydrogenase [Bacteroidales bacterium]